MQNSSSIIWDWLLLVVNRMPKKCCFCSGWPSTAAAAAPASAAGEEMLIDTFIGAAKLTFAIFYWHSRGVDKNQYWLDCDSHFLWCIELDGHSRRDGLPWHPSAIQSVELKGHGGLGVTLYRKIIFRREGVTDGRVAVAVRIKCDNNLRFMY